MASDLNDRPRFTILTPLDHRPGLWIATILSAAYATLTLLARHLIGRRKFSTPDIVLASGYLLAACSYALMFVALTNGAGIARQSLEEGLYKMAAQLVYFAVILLLLASGLAICSQLFQLGDIVVLETDKRVCRAAIAMVLIFTILIPITISAGCSSARALDAPQNAHCSASTTRWSVAAALAIVVQLISSGLPYYLFRKLHARLQQKAIIYAAFSSPLANIPLIAAALKLHLNRNNSSESSDGTGSVGFLCCLEALLCWSLIAPSIPMCRPMALRFTTHGTLILNERSGGNSIDTGVPSACAVPEAKKLPSFPYNQV